MPIGYKMGIELAQTSPKLLILFGFIIGMVVVLAEPAVHVLNRQVEEVTAGSKSSEPKAVQKLELLVLVVNRSKAEFYLDYLNTFEINLHTVMPAQGIAFALPVSNVVGLSTFSDKKAE